MSDGFQKQIVAWLKLGLSDLNIGQAEFARRMSAEMNRAITRDIINKIFMYKRDVSVAELYAMAKILRREPPTPKLELQTPLVGYVGAGATVAFYGNAQGPTDYVESPPDASVDTVAVEVRGDSMYGVANNGWLLFFDRRENVITPDMLGQLCVVGLSDERVVVKEVLQGSRPDAFNLISTNAPPMLDQTVEWIAPVTWIKQRRAR